MKPHNQIAIKILLTAWLTLSGVGHAVGASFEADSTAHTSASDEDIYDPISPIAPKNRSTEWIHQLVAKNFEFEDTTIDYPRFPRFCVDVYKWFQGTFNSYDTAYVSDPVTNWMVYLRNFNWMKNYSLFFPDRQRIRMLSDVYSDIGPHVDFMIFGAGYTFKANDFLHMPAAKRRNFDTSISCARFSLLFMQQSIEGGVNIERFGRYNNGRHVWQPFGAVNQHETTIDGYWFFSPRYSHAAAYGFNKHQIKSAGTFICGANYERQNLFIDFSHLPDDMRAYVPDGRMDYHFDYSSYNLIMGYGYNWSIVPRRWLFNITCLPAVGYKHVYREGTGGRKDMFSGNMRAMSAVVYDRQHFFTTLSGRFDGSLVLADGYTFVNNGLSLTFTLGTRF